MCAGSVFTMHYKTKYFAALLVFVTGLLSTKMVFCGLFNGKPIAVSHVMLG